MRTKTAIFINRYLNISDSRLKLFVDFDELQIQPLKTLVAPRHHLENVSWLVTLAIAALPLIQHLKTLLNGKSKNVLQI